jgi:alpha,alpha-trehalase
VDLYSAARRLGRPVEFGPDTAAGDLSIGAHGLIGDGWTAALVRLDGAIDWLCLPRFDSPSVFGALLDGERGGLTAITPAHRPFTSLQAYDPGTNVLETLFEVEGQGAVRLVDFMPWTDDPRAAIHEVHRRIECVEGAVDLDVIFDPRFDYGRDPARLDIDGVGVLARGARDERLVAVVDGDDWQAMPGGGARARLRVKAGERRWMVLSWDAVRPEPLALYRSFEHLRATRRHWRDWANRLQYDGPWRHAVLRSALCLKLLTYAPSGAMVAAPTTSLPEWIGGGRNWDYRYVWVRDASLSIRANNLIGYATEAREFFHFVREAVDLDHGLQIMYGLSGGPVPDEQELGHLAGYQGSRPVRIGNGAKGQLQLDTAGALVDAAHLYEHFGGSLSLRAWRKIRAVVEGARRLADQPDHGIWEPRTGRRHNVYSKLMTWVALDRGANLAAIFGEDGLRAGWMAHATTLHAEIMARGVDPTGRHFVSAYGETSTDAALLNIALHGFMPDGHPLIGATLDRVRADLADGPFLYRYRADDGVGGDEGAFVLCGFWLAEALVLAGRIDEALEVFVAHAQAANHVGLLSEEIDPRSGALLGNFPQSFSHLGLINAALRIDLALRLRDEGSARGAHLIRDSLRRKA